MKRIAFKMKLKSGCKEEYKKRHEHIWPELISLLKENNISDYSIFLDEETDMLFAVQTMGGPGSALQMGQNPVVQKWWRYMADIMDTNADFSPVAKSLTFIFHLD